MGTLTDNLNNYSIKQEICDIYIKGSPTMGCKPNMAYCLLLKDSSFEYILYFEIVEYKSEKENLMISGTLFKFQYL